MNQVLDIPERELCRRRAVLSADVSELRDLVDPDCVYVHSSGFVDTGRNLLDRLARGEVRYERLDAFEDTVTIIGDVTVITYLQSSTTIFDGAPHESRARCTAVWTGSRVGERMIAFHSGEVR